MHVKRFQQDLRGRLSKIAGAVAFPINLNLTPFCDPKVPPSCSLPAPHQLTARVIYADTAGSLLSYA